MPAADLLETVVKLSVGAIATFLAILLWANTRDSGWMLVVLGVVVQYGGVMYAVFEQLGVLPAPPPILGLPLIRLLMDNLPMALFALGFVVALSRTRLR